MATTNQVKTYTVDEFIHAYAGDHEQAAEHLKEALASTAEKFNPDGWMLLECQVLDSSYMGQTVVLPYGGDATHKTVPGHPISPRGLASDMSVVIGTLSRYEYENTKNKEVIEAFVKKENLTFADFVKYFAAPEDDPFVKEARRRSKDGEIEVDSCTVRSGSAGDGDYVMAWLWVHNEDVGLPSIYDEEDADE